MRCTGTRTTWQRAMVVAVIVGGIVLSICRAINEWPSLPLHHPLDAGKYAERVSLLKYFMSLGFSVIGGTWYLVSSTPAGQKMSRASLSILSWAWTCLGISLLSAIVEIYLSYKDFYSWPVWTNEGYTGPVHRFRHAVYLNILHCTYMVTDYLFFAGAGLVVIALVGSLDIRSGRCQE